MGWAPGVGWGLITSCCCIRIDVYSLRCVATSWGGGLITSCVCIRTDASSYGIRDPSRYGWYVDCTSARYATLVTCLHASDATLITCLHATVATLVTCLHATVATLVARLHATAWRKNLGNLNTKTFLWHLTNFGEDPSSLIACCRREKRHFCKHWTHTTSRNPCNCDDWPTAKYEPWTN